MAFYLYYITNYLPGVIVAILNIMFFLIAGIYLIYKDSNIKKLKKPKPITHPIVKVLSIYFIVGSFNAIIVIKYFPIIFDNPGLGLIFHITNIFLSILIYYIYWSKSIETGSGSKLRRKQSK